MNAMKSPLKQCDQLQYKVTSLSFVVSSGNVHPTLKITKSTEINKRVQENSSAHKKSKRKRNARNSSANYSLQTGSSNSSANHSLLNGASKSLANHSPQKNANSSLPDHSLHNGTITSKSPEIISNEISVFKDFSSAPEENTPWAAESVIKTETDSLKPENPKLVPEIILSDLRKRRMSIAPKMTTVKTTQQLIEELTTKNSGLKSLFFQTVCKESGQEKSNCSLQKLPGDKKTNAKLFSSEPQLVPNYLPSSYESLSASSRPQLPQKCSHRSLSASSKPKLVQRCSPSPCRSLLASSKPRLVQKCSPSSCQSLLASSKPQRMHSSLSHRPLSVSSKPQLLQKCLPLSNGSPSACLKSQLVRKCSPPSKNNGKNPVTNGPSPNFSTAGKPAITSKRKNDAPRVDPIDAEVKQILSQLPPINYDEINLYSDEDPLPAEKKPSMDEDVESILSKQWEFVNGCYAADGSWAVWQTCTDVEISPTETFRILPYVNID